MSFPKLETVSVSSIIALCMKVFRYKKKQPKRQTESILKVLIIMLRKLSDCIVKSVVRIWEEVVIGCGDAKLLYIFF
jgi:hypothetical protein